MFVQFFLVVASIATVGPGHIEGGFAAIEQKGFKQAIVDGLKNPDISVINQETYDRLVND